MNRIVKIWISLLSLAALAALGAVLYFGVFHSPLQNPQPAENPWRIQPDSSYRQIRVEVLNASGVRDLARKTTMFLRDLGFDVVYYGNYPKGTVEHTVIVDRVSPDYANARVLQKILGVPILDYERDPDKLLEVSLVLGKDYEQYLGRYLKKTVLY